MELRAFKEWIIENNFENNELFQESIVCYCNRAYRSAYMFSYLAFIEYLRDTILEYKGVPVKFEEKYHDNHHSEKINDKWKEIINDLKNEDSWENRLLIVINEAKYNIFFMIQK